MKKPPRRPAVATVYTLLDEISASTTEPLPEHKRRFQLTRMHAGLAAIERAQQPALDDWRVCADAVNLMETLVAMGELADASGLLPDAVRALAAAGGRHHAGHAIRLDAPGIQAIRAVLEDYAAALEALPARTVIRAHRATEKRIRDILADKRRAHDVEVMDL